MYSSCKSTGTSDLGGRREGFPDGEADGLVGGVVRLPAEGLDPGQVVTVAGDVFLPAAGSAGEVEGDALQPHLLDCDFGDPADSGPGLGADSRCSSSLRLRSSTAVIRTPSARSRSQRREPINPVPPVTRMCGSLFIPGRWITKFPGETNRILRAGVCMARGWVEEG